MRWRLIERIWMEPSLTPQEIMWIRYQVQRQFPGQELTTVDIGLTGYLRPVLLQPDQTSCPSELVERIEPLQPSEQSTLLGLLYDFVSSLFPPGHPHPYQHAAQMIWQHGPDLFNLTSYSYSSSGIIPTVLLNYLIAILEYYALTPNSLCPDALYQCLSLIRRIASSDALIIRIIPALTALYFKAVSRGELLMAGLAVRLLADLPIPPVIQEAAGGIAVAMEKRARMVDHCWLEERSSFQKPIVEICSGEKSEGLQQFYSLLSPKLSPTTNTRAVPAGLSSLGVFPLLKVPRQLEYIAATDCLVGRDIHDVVYVIRGILPHSQHHAIDPPVKERLGIYQTFLVQDDYVLGVKTLAGDRLLLEVWQISLKAKLLFNFTLPSTSPAGAALGIKLVYRGERLGWLLLIIQWPGVVSLYPQNAPAYCLRREEAMAIKCFTVVDGCILLSDGLEGFWRVSLTTGRITRELYPPVTALSSEDEENWFAISNEKSLLWNGKLIYEADQRITSLRVIEGMVYMGDELGNVYSYSPPANHGLMLVNSLQYRLDMPLAIIPIKNKAALIIHGLNDLYYY